MPAVLEKMDYYSNVSHHESSWSWEWNLWCKPNDLVLRKGVGTAYFRMDVVNEENDLIWNGETRKSDKLNKISGQIWKEVTLVLMHGLTNLMAWIIIWANDLCNCTCIHEYGLFKVICTIYLQACVSKIFVIGILIIFERKQ